MRKKGLLSTLAAMAMMSESTHFLESTHFMGNEPDFNPKGLKLPTGSSDLTYSKGYYSHEMRKRIAARRKRNKIARKSRKINRKKY